MILQLEEIAVCLERFMPKRLRCGGDVATAQHVRRIYGKAGSAIRDLKKWVATPRADTREQLILRITECLFLVKSGNWDGLAALSTATESRSRWSLFYERAKKAMLPVLLGASATTMIYLLSHLPGLETIRIWSYVAGPMVWFLSASCAGDVSLGPKIESLIKLRSLFTFTK